MIRPHSHHPPGLTEPQFIAKYLRLLAQQGGTVNVGMDTMHTIRRLGVELDYPSGPVPGILTPAEAIRYAEQLDQLTERPA